MARVLCQAIVKEFSPGSRAVDDVSLDIADGELLVMVGPSGCGKSTLLRIVAGLETPTSGEVRIGDAVVNDLSPQQRNVAMVFQDYALYPHMTVRRNLEFPLRMRRMARTDIDARVARTAELLGLSPLLERLPKQLSGGQRQRVAMGRALVREPSVSLLDEPLSNLDAKLRVQVRAEIAELQRRTGTTMVYVTHDQVEAMTLGHRVAVLDHGRLQQVAPPAELYERPVNAFVAGFLGSPPMNLLRAGVSRVGDGLVLRVGAQTVGVAVDGGGDGNGGPRAGAGAGDEGVGRAGASGGNAAGAGAGSRGASGVGSGGVGGEGVGGGGVGGERVGGERVGGESVGSGGVGGERVGGETVARLDRGEIARVATVGIRPEAVELDMGDATAGSLRATVEHVELLGHETLVHTSLTGGGEETQRVVARVQGTHALIPGSTVRLRLPARALHFFDAQGMALRKDR
ncbi:MAG: ATP-binding cassette domain-containing protein [Deltaproteobacteria bacterium]|nr:ATP-binding cassette domain-containing protein [Deltaproteobacteria bacterium]